jgi:hypothetical protein
MGTSDLNSFRNFDVLEGNNEPMKKLIVYLFLFAVIPLFTRGENDSVTVESTRQNQIISGFYLKLGPVLPMGNYAKGQSVPFQAAGIEASHLNYLPAEIGGVLDLGFMIYLGPSFANKRLRVGLDYTFFSLWFNSTSPQSQENLAEKYYSFFGQKLGPVITVNPVGKFMIDVSYKLNAQVGYHDENAEWLPYPDSKTSEWGLNFLFQEASLCLRYSIISFSVQYNFGRMNYNNYESGNSPQEIEANTIRLLFGFKF